MCTVNQNATLSIMCAAKIKVSNTSSQLNHSIFLFTALIATLDTSRLALAMQAVRVPPALIFLLLFTDHSLHILADDELMEAADEDAEDRDSIEADSPKAQTSKRDSWWDDMWPTEKESEAQA